MILRVLSLLCISLFSGCASLPQVYFDEPRQDLIAHISPEGGLSVGWRSKTTYPALQSDLDVAASFATSSSGKKLYFVAQERTYHTSEKTYWKDITLFLRESQKTREETLSWTPGDWLLHLTFTSRVPRAPIETKITISNFQYNPIIHGPPN